MEPRTHPTLALDTSGDAASACVVSAGGGALRVAREGERAGLVLHHLIAEVLEEAGIRMADLGLIAVARGPGSFTGLRVGLAAAQGLALASGITAVGIETTWAIAEASGRTGEVLVFLDAGQGRFFAGLHRPGSPEAATLRVPDDLSADEAIARARAHGSSCVVRGKPPHAGELLAAGCQPFTGPLAPALARLAPLVAPEPEGLQALYARALVIRPPQPPRLPRER